MTNTKKTKIALIQMHCGPDPEKNFSRAIEFIHQAAKQGAQVVCLPELFRSQYFCQTEDHENFELAEEVPGRSTSARGLLRHSSRNAALAFIITRQQSSTQMESC